MDNILDHFKNPRHKGELKDYSTKYAEANLSCGDKVEITVLLKDGILKDAKFNGNGCAISQAGISILLEEVIGYKAEDILKINKDNILEMIGIELGPVRLKCALLGLETLKQAIRQSI